jgi:hypothetical protein
MSVNVKSDFSAVDSADELNELARRLGWAVLCDVACSFDFRAFDDLRALWHAKAGVAGIPKRSAMTARLLLPYIKMLTIHERIVRPDGARRYRIRLMGDAQTLVTGAKAGNFYEDFLTASAVPKWNAMNDAVLAHGAPVRFLFAADSFDKMYLVGEAFAAPLLTDGGQPDFVLSAVHFDEKVHWDDVVAHWRAGPHCASA